MRTTPEMRHLFAKHGGNLSEPNSVAWMFEKRGFISIPNTSTTEEQLMELMLEAGADDLDSADDNFEVVCMPDVFHAVQKALEAAGIESAEAAIVMEPQNTVELDGKKAEQCLRLLEFLEDHDDVQNVYANLDVVDEDVGTQAG